MVDVIVSLHVNFHLSIEHGDGWTSTAIFHWTVFFKIRKRICQNVLWSALHLWRLWEQVLVDEQYTRRKGNVPVLQPFQLTKTRGKTGFEPENDLNFM